MQGPYKSYYPQQIIIKTLKKRQFKNVLRNFLKIPSLQSNFDCKIIKTKYKKYQYSIYFTSIIFKRVILSFCV
jgi:hypothetical protein